MKNIVKEKIKELKIITIVRGVEKDKCLNLAEALYNGGIRFMEFAFDPKCSEKWADTADTISCLNKRMGDRMFFGAGTVLNKEQVDLTVKAGGKFVVAPNTNKSVISYANKQELVTIPGAMTPTEILEAYDDGADFVKLFPAAYLGIDYYKIVSVPLRQVPLIPTGGITIENAKGFIDAGATALAIGGALTDRKALANDDYEIISENARVFVKEIQ